jgi:hypothetical protein
MENPAGTYLRRLMDTLEAIPVIRLRNLLLERRGKRLQPPV